MNDKATQIVLPWMVLEVWRERQVIEENSLSKSLNKLRRRLRQILYSHMLPCFCSVEWREQITETKLCEKKILILCLKQIYCNNLLWCCSTIYYNVYGVQKCFGSSREKARWGLGLIQRVLLVRPTYSITCLLWQSIKSTKNLFLQTCLEHWK